MSRATTIFIKDYRLEMFIGVYAAEKADKQCVVVNIAAECDLEAEAVDDIQATVSYEYFISVVDDLAEKKHYNLAETFAEEIAATVLAMPGVAGVRVKVEKPDVFCGNPVVGVEIFRQR